MVPPPDDALTVLSFWFGELDVHGLAGPERTRLWFSANPQFDTEIRRRFSSTYDALVAGEARHWCATPRGCLAAVVVLDQFSRNMFRGTPRAFAEDAQALGLASDAIHRGWDGTLVTEERAFLYMPFMHAEDLAAQERGIRLFETFRDELDGPARERVAESVSYAYAHRDIIARFGRFPHRNEILDRPSTAEELDFLTQPGSRF